MTASGGNHGLGVAYAGWMRSKPVTVILPESTPTLKAQKIAYELRGDGRTIFIESKGYFFLDRQGHLSRMIGFLEDVTVQRHAQDELARAHDGLEARVAERTSELAHAYAVIQDRALQQEAVALLGQYALAGAELPAVYEEALARVRAVLKVEFCIVMEVAPGGEEFLVRAKSGGSPDLFFPRIPTDRGSQSGYALLVGEPVVVEDMATETRFSVCAPLQEIGMRSGVSVQIAAGEEAIGTLGAFCAAPRKFTRDDVHFLQSVANVLSAAIARQRAEESVRQAREQAEHANRAKSDFLSRMSHELRTPLNAILGFTQLLEMDGPTASQAESILHITRAGRHLLMLINEVLDIARIESGGLALSPEPIPVASFVQAAVELIRPLAHRHGVSLAVHATVAESGSHVLADAQRLKQVLLNLLSNAVKYNRPGGSVVVSGAPAAGDKLRLRVRDTGIGIARAKLPRLFIPFERLGAERTDVEGTGIGLALSRGIVHALGGELGVETVEGEGSTFWVELALAEPPEMPEPPAPVAPPAPAPGAGPPCTLLYIEDQDLNLRLVERILLHQPRYKLLSAMQGRLGIDLAREHRPDLILLDLNLPDMLGDEVLAALKADPRMRDIPVIMVSADAMGDRIEQLLAAGAAAYLTKPYRVTEFLRVIHDTLPPAH